MIAQTAHMTLTSQCSRGSWVLLSFLAAFAARAEKPYEAGKVYKGDDGVRVIVVPLVGGSTRQAIVHVSGSGSELDGKAPACEVAQSGDKLDYKTLRHGRNYALLIARQGWGGRQFTLSVPGKRDGVSVFFDEKETAALNSDETYQLHQKQKGDGTLASLQAFQRKPEEEKNEKQLAELVTQLNAACGTAVSANIAWASIDDDALKRISISSYCGTPVETLTALCASKAGKTAVTAKVSALSCQFGSALKMELDTKSKVLTYTTFPDAPNQADFAKSQLEKKL